MENLENSSNNKELVDNESKLTKKQHERIERNRQKALLLRKSRLAKESSLKSQSCKEQTVKVPPKLQNTGGGFLLEECDDEPSQLQTIYIEQAPPIEEDRLHCEKCDVEFVDSFLLTNFNVYICDNCRESDGCHKLITRTDAKKEYLLKDCDLDKREPPLKYIVKKNPHYSRGDMKLYLKCQVEERAKMVWESEENLETARDQRVQDRDKRKKKAYDKKIKALRMSVRSSLYRQTNTSHDHDYGEEMLKEDDVYEKTCKTCGHVLTYEKM